jgi:hypothetical protein
MQHNNKQTTNIEHLKEGHLQVEHPARNSSTLISGTSAQPVALATILLNKRTRLSSPLNAFFNVWAHDFGM